MSEAPSSPSRENLKRLIEKSRFDLGPEERLFGKRREAHRRLDDTMHLLDGVEDALRKVRSTRQG
jgi:hypothetical protein